LAPVANGFSKNQSWPFMRLSLVCQHKPTWARLVKRERRGAEHAL
jgi:hypothetical protein